MRKLIILFLLLPCFCFGQNGVTVPGIQSSRFSVPAKTYRYYGGAFHRLLDIDSANLLYAPIFTLTTTGSSGAATYSGNVLNIPQYSGGSGTVSSIATSTGILGGTITTTGTLKADTSVLQTILNLKPLGSTYWLKLSGGQTMTGSFTSQSILAASNSAYSLGSSSVAFLNVYSNNFYSPSSFNIGTLNANSFNFVANNIAVVRLDASQNMYPVTTNSEQLGLSTNLWKNFFTTNYQVSLTGMLIGNGAGSNVSAVTTLPTAYEPAHTGDVTNTAGSLALTITSGAVTTAKADTGSTGLAPKAYVNNYAKQAQNNNFAGQNTFTNTNYFSQNLKVYNSSKTILFTIDGSSITGAYTGTLPNKNGTFAMLSDLTPVVASADPTAQTAANTSVATYTTTANGTFRIGGYINIATVTVDVIEMQVTYTDENSTSQTANFFTQGATSPLLSSVSNSAFPTMDIRCKTGTAITVKTTLTTGTGSILYDCGATITQLR